MLGEKSKTRRETIQFASPEMLVPKNHLLRKIDAAINFDDIYDIVRPLYCHDNGRPSMDPVVLFKIVMLQHIYGIPSLRQTISEINMNIAYRWFIGYDLSETIPHFATVSYNFRHRFTPETIEMVFEWILGIADKEGYLSADVAFLDGTHIKANANNNKRRKKEIEKKARSYARQLREEINEDREAHGKKPFDDDPPGGSAEEGKAAEAVTVTESTTDPESGVFHKGEHKRCFAYNAQTVCDRNGFILAATVNAGNMHDSVAFDGIYRDVTERFPELKWIVADAGYKTPWICKRIFDDGRIPSLPYTRPMTKRASSKSMNTSTMSTTIVCSALKTGY